jgi:hypothetical protein
MSLSRTDHLMRSAQRLEVGQSLPHELQLGINWLDHHFSLDDTRGDQDNFYYMWAIQNVGQATGYRTFNKIDWYRDAATRLLNTQQANGSWSGPKGTAASTSFALLYLARARGPLAICKLRFDGNWNNRPADLFNFTEYLSEQFETPTSWLMSDLDQHVYELIESPLLYLATDKPFSLPATQINRLKEYIEAGGTLVCAPEGKNIATAQKSFTALAEQLFPGRELKRIDKKHEFYTLQQKLQGNIPVSVLENAVRPLIVIVEKDVSRELQADDPRNRDAFKLLANIYLYSTGLDPKRPRLKTNYIAPPAKPETREGFGVARVKTAAGEFDPEPGAMPQLAAFMAARCGIDLKIATCNGGELSDREKLAFLTVDEKTSIADADAKAIRAWLEHGGTLWVDSPRGESGALAQMDQILAKLGVSASSLTALPNDSNILSGKGLTGGYDNRRLPKRRFTREQAGGKAAVLVTKINNRPAVFVSRGDISAGLAGLNHWEISGLEPRAARQVVANLVLSLQQSPATQPTTK